MAERIEACNDSSSLLVMEGVCKRFGATVALDDVGISVRPGEVLALVGENGAGKSTLMKVLSGAIKSDGGRMKLGGEEFSPHNPLQARLSGVTMVYQELSLAGHLSVEENIMLGMEPSKFGIIGGREVRRRAKEALAEFDNPELLCEAKVSELSVGSQQLTEIARALAVGCRVLVLDEPTSSLTQHDVERLFSLIRLLKEQGKAIVYISHFIEEVKQIADRVTVLRDGKVVDTRQVGEVSTDEIISMMVGRQVEDLYPRSKRQAGDIALEVEGLSGKSKPESASFELRRGEVLGIGGLVGAGRTELLRCIFGLDEVKSGKVRIGVYSGGGPAKRWKQGAGFVSEDRKDEGLAVSMSISDNVTLSNLRGFGPFGLVLPSRQEMASEKWIERLDIRCEGAGQKVDSLSGGNQQKVALARLLEHDVDVLLLDEPTRGIDVGAKAMIYKLIDSLASGSEAEGIKPKAILMVSSYLPELMGVCDRVGVMCRGKLGEIRNVEETDEHRLMQEATGAETKI